MICVTIFYKVQFYTVFLYYHAFYFSVFFCFGIIYNMFYIIVTNERPKKKNCADVFTKRNKKCFFFPLFLCFMEK